MTKEPPRGESESFLRTGGALRGRLWSELSAELAARGNVTPERDADPSASARPERIGAYKILGLLGSGGMGEVLLAFDARLQRHVAIKRIRAGKEMNARARARLRREAAAAAALNHPAVVHVYDILDEPSGEAIVMEYAEGYTLAHTLATGRLPASKAIGLMRQVAEGLAAAHAVGLIHRDLKSQNVVVTASGHAKILDFGIAKRLLARDDEDSLTAEGALLGTTRSMSPEQAEGRPLDARSDLFSLGVLLYEVCTGRSPFEGGSSLQTLHNVIAEPPAPLVDLNPDLPPPLVALVGELLEKDPAQRPAGAAEVAERLGHIEHLPDLRGLELPYARATGLATVSFLSEEALPVARARAVDRRVRHSRVRRGPLVAAVALATVAAALSVARIPKRAATTRPLAVLVQEPRVASLPDERSRLAAFAVREAVFGSLLNLQGVEAVGPDELAGTNIPAQDAPRAAAADEVVTSTLACEGAWCRVALRRQRGGDGRIVADAGSFDVSSAPEDSLSLANAVAIHVRKVYADHTPRSAEQRTEVRSLDYHRYLSLRRSTEAGEVLSGADIDELEQLARSSPGLTEASLLAANASRILPDQPRAERILREAGARHPGDLRLADELFQLRLDGGQLAAAEAALAELERLAPGDIRVWRARARLLSRQGRPQQAAEFRRRMVRERPSWKNLWYLADVEIELGDARAARLHLEQLLELSPRNPRGLEKMAELEWEMGDPARAARIYEDLVSRKPDRLILTNLGWSLLLAGDYSGAVAANRRALALEPDHLLSLLNLGVAHEGAGDAENGRRCYRELLDRVAARERAGALKGAEPLIKAQALARLGVCVPAVDITMKALGEGDHSAQTSFRAAIVHALCGERNHAVVHARNARARGLSPWWFGIPGFEPLQGTPGFRDLAPRTGRSAPAPRTDAP